MAHPADRTRALVAAVAGLVLLALSGCGERGNSKPDLVNGKTLFAGKGTCGSCHTLARAGTKGTQGPNLDAAFVAARHDGLGEGTIEGVVRDQISRVRRGSIMPRDLVKGEDARDVAAYVGYAAGAVGKDTGALAQAGVKAGGKPVAEKAGTLTIPADPTGALAFVSNKATAKAGKVAFVMPNKSPIKHDISVKGAGVNQNGPQVGQGGSSKLTASLKPGTYTFYCSVPGHEQGGMKGTLTVK